MQRTSSPSQQPLLDETDMSIMTNPTKSWDQLRKEARSLESEIESKLAALSKVGQSTGLDDIGQELETDELLKKVYTHIYKRGSCNFYLFIIFVYIQLQLVITGMGDFIDKPSSTPTNPSMIHLLSRHKDILYDYTKEFRKVKVRTIHRKKERKI